MRSSVTHTQVKQASAARATRPTRHVHTSTDATRAMDATWRTWRTDATRRAALRATIMAKVAISHALAMMAHPHTWATIATAPTLDAIATDASRVREARRVARSRQVAFSRHVWAGWFTRRNLATWPTRRVGAGWAMARVAYVSRVKHERRAAMRDAHVRRSLRWAVNLAAREVNADAIALMEANEGTEGGSVKGTRVYHMAYVREARFAPRGASGIKGDRVKPGERVTQRDHHRYIPDQGIASMPMLTTVGVASHPDADASDYDVALNYVRTHPGEATVRVTYADGTTAIKPVAEYTAVADERRAAAREARAALRAREARQVVAATIGAHERNMSLLRKVGYASELATGAA